MIARDCNPSSSKKRRNGTSSSASYFSLKALIASSECCLDPTQELLLEVDGVRDASIDDNCLTFFVEFNSFCNDCIDVFDTVNCKSKAPMSFSDFRIVSIRESQPNKCLFVSSYLS